MVFSSDWGDALGTGTSAKNDGGRWNILSDNANGLEVVTCGSLGFPMANCLQVTALEVQGGFARLARTGLGIPAVGESRFYRWYYRNEVPSTDDNSTHPIESGQTGGLDWSFNVEVQSNTTWRPEFRPGAETMNREAARWTGPLLDSGVTYRFELEIHKVSGTQFQLHARVFNADGSLRLDDDDFNNHAAGLGPTVMRTLADNPLLNFSSAGGANLDELRAGNNGLSTGAGYVSHLFAYQGGVAVCAGTWCGPWQQGE